MQKKKTIIIAALFSILFLGTYLSDVEVKPRLEVEPRNIPFPFENVSLEAKSAYVFDIVKNEPIFELNADAQLPLASLAKIMTAVAAKENLPEWLKIDLSREAVLQEGDSGFLIGEQWSVDDLIEVALISSSNDAAFALAAAGNLIPLMNKKSEELNLNQSYFLNPTGLDLSKSIAGAYGSAKDVAEMLKYGLKNYPALFEITSFGDFQIMERQFKNTNKLVNEIPRLIAGKTGFSDLAGGNLAVIVDIGLIHPVIIVALGSSEQGRFEDIKKLYSETLKYMSVKYRVSDSF